MRSHFFAYISRMKLIDRWGLMRCTQPENVQEHSLQVAVIAHALVVIRNKYFNGALNPEHVATLALFHDASEVLTGDLPTPVKYFNSDIQAAYKTIEKSANERLLQLLPEDLRVDYRSLLQPTEADREYAEVVKGADSLSAYIKCLEERASGNPEFKVAEKTILTKLLASPLPEIQYFLEHYIPSYSLSLDEISGPSS